MSLDRAAALTEEEMISEAFAALAGTDNGHGPLRLRVYVVDALVLAVTEHEPAPAASHHLAAATDRPKEGIPDRGAVQRRTTVEAVTGQRVAATLRGRRSVPDVLFELFVLEPADGSCHGSRAH